MVGCCCSSPSMPPLVANKTQLQGRTLVEDGIEFKKRSIKLPSIFATDQAYNAHRVLLEDWSRQCEASDRNVGRKQANCSSSRSDLYQILGLFFVFQGVVLTAVAQANLLRCHNWFLPFLLCLLTSLAAFFACLQKLKEMLGFSDQLRLERAHYISLHKSVEKLKEQGTDLDVIEAQPELTGLYTEPELTGKGACDNLYSSLARFTKVWIISYAGGVLLLLFVFTGVTLFSIRQILCNPGSHVG